MPSTKEYQLGIALSGGGAKGFAHVGVMKALDDFGLCPDIIAGVSAGGVIGAFYAAGVAPDDVLGMFGKIKMGALADWAIPNGGIFKLNKFKHFLKQNLPVDKIEDLKIPTVITATNLDTYCEELFTHGPLAECIIASCSIPVIFKPARIAGTSYIDGGILHNMPSFAIRARCDFLIGVNVSPLNTSPFKSTIADIAYRSYRLMTTHNSQPDLNLCDAVIDVESMKNSSTFGVDRMKENAKEGYFAAMRALINNPDLIRLRDERKNH